MYIFVGVGWNSSDKHSIHLHAHTTTTTSHFQTLLQTCEIWNAYIIPLVQAPDTLTFHPILRSLATQRVSKVNQQNGETRGFTLLCEWSTGEGVELHSI